MTKMIGLFAGPGGICWGGELAGIKSVGIEWDADACATRRAAGLETVQGDVRAYGPSDFPGCTVLTAGPPCQTFTTTGTGTGREQLSMVLSYLDLMALGCDVRDDLKQLKDERTGLVLEPLRWALEAHGLGTPYRTIVLEQVPAVLPVWEAMAEVLTDLGYSVATGVLRTERYGVPQTRKRAVLVASLDRFAQLPEPSHLPYRAGQLNDCVTMGDVLDRPEPFTVISNYGTGGDASRRGQRTQDQPAFTVTGKVSRNRLVALDGRELPRLTHAEAGALQTFPHSYPWSGKDIPQQIGNAVPPLFAAAVLRAALGL
ncbi:DNA methylase [Streptomyces phage Maih]|uniref:DNA (cytosine-5-)-methyltransferase n=1 Tax=Streptomyces phage Maih TaxID=1775283 RepID=A0A0U4IHB6_9CAUD|nr:DNA methylase [Streptomyces phage Maih]USH45415.1 DNA methyltransferase [Streptomyces phage Asis]